MPSISDGTCPSCVNGDINVCSQIAFIGINTKSGGMSERAVVPADLVFKLPDSMDCDVGGVFRFFSIAIVQL